MNYTTYDFLSRLRECNGGNDTWDVILDYFTDVGFDVVNFGIIEEKSQAVKGMFTNMSDDWMRYYVDRELYVSDPIIKQVLNSKNDFLYTERTKNRLPGIEDKKAQLICQEVAPLGIRTAIQAPFHHSHDNFIVGFNLGTALETDEFLKFVDANYRDIFMGTAIAQGFMPKLIDQRREIDSWYPLEEKTNLLSDREIETLKWIAQGLRVDRIADKMNIANVTVNFHITQIKKKLQAKTREHAVAIAFMEGLIR